jgi:SAM-dependent methyltransferase
MHKAVQAVHSVVQRAVWVALDAGETLVGKKDPLTPPRRLMNVGSNEFTRSDFNRIGGELFQRLVAIGGLRPDDKVLDVGCGVGRMAIPLTRYLSAQGTYDGFDIVAESIEHCANAYRPRFKQFHFHHADLFNTTYNPGGRYLSHEYRFPFADQSFSFVFLTSVFTHILSQGVENYLREIRRVLVPGGRCFITFFVLNEQSEQMIHSGKSALAFAHSIDHGKSTHVDQPEAAVAFDEAYIRQIYRQTGLDIVEPIRYGSWSGTSSDVGYQDIVVAVKRAAGPGAGAAPHATRVG